jgi:hypothetical protein
VQTELRAGFQHWGMPQAVRVDNGSPWGSWSDWPPALALGLIGLGIEVIGNDPRRPQQNGVVERSQGTGQRWAEPQTCDRVADLQQRLEESDRWQREHYPYQDGQSRCQVFGSVQHSGRPYASAHDEQHGDMTRVLPHLATYVVRRQVDNSGTISVWNRTHYVGPAYAGQLVWVRLDPLEHQWIIASQTGEQIRSKPAKELTAEAVRRLQIRGSK